MAHFVAKEIGMRPGEILDTWSVPELIVAYGEYMNEISRKNYAEWRAMPVQSRGSQPEEYIVEFIGVDRLEE